jgi:hypothetical protein
MGHVIYAIRKSLMITLVSLFVSGCSPRSKAPSSESEPPNVQYSSQQAAINTKRDSCWSFVQGFYDWYVPQTTREQEQIRKEPSSDLALKYKRDAFSPTLFKALKDDSDAQADSDELVGIDFDPFLASQDPDDRYEVQNVTHDGNVCRAEVYGVSSGSKRSSPDVIPELVRWQKTWRFVNFHYPDLDNSDLLTILREAAEDRQKYRE